MKLENLQEARYDNRGQVISKKYYLYSIKEQRYVDWLSDDWENTHYTGKWFTFRKSISVNTVNWDTAEAAKTALQQVKESVDNVPDFDFSKKHFDYQLSKVQKQLPYIVVVENITLVV